MAEYVNKEMFLSQMGLVGDETKYGNRDAEHQSRSYSSWMGYEIMGSIDDCVEEDVVKVVRCKDCKFGEMCSIREAMACIVPDGFCWRGERRTDDKETG